MECQYDIYWDSLKDFEHDSGGYIMWKKDTKHDSTLEAQEGGSHYQMPIQPIEFIVANSIPFREANVIKYVVRHANKNGAEDLKKARHYIDMLIEGYKND